MLYQYVPETKLVQKPAALIFPDENSSVKFKRSRSASEQMIACFFLKFGHVVTNPLQV